MSLKNSSTMEDPVDQDRAEAVRIPAGSEMVDYPAPLEVRVEAPPVPILPAASNPATRSSMSVLSMTRRMESIRPSTFPV